MLKKIASPKPILKLLLVVDQYALALRLKRRLYRSGIAILGPTPDLRTTTAFLEREEPDGAVLDLDLRDAKAFSIAKMLRARSIPVILLLDDPEELTHLKDLQDLPYLLKAVAPEELPLQAMEWFNRQRLRAFH